MLSHPDKREVSDTIGLGIGLAAGTDATNRRTETSMATTDNGAVAGISTGGVLVLVGLALWLLAGWTFIGIVLIIIGLVAFGGFARGRWY